MDLIIGIVAVVMGIVGFIVSLKQQKIQNAKKKNK